MLKELPAQPQSEMFRTVLASFINSQHELSLLAKEIGWDYLSGTAGDKVNTLLAASAYNMKKWMRLKKKEILNLIFRWIFQRLMSAQVNIQR